MLISYLILNMDSGQQHNKEESQDNTGSHPLIHHTEIEKPLHLKKMTR